MKQEVEQKRKVTVHHRVGQVFRLVDGRGPVRSVSWTERTYSVHYHEEAKWLKLPWVESREQDNLDRHSPQLLLQMSANVYHFSDISHSTIPKGGLDPSVNSGIGWVERHREGLKLRPGLCKALTPALSRLGLSVACVRR